MKRMLFAVVFLAWTQASARAAEQYIPVPNPQPLPDFVGFYAAAGAGYGVSVQRSFSMDVSFGGGASGQVAPQGWLGTALTGYNIQYGALLGGIEVSGRWGKEAADGLPASVTYSTGTVRGGMDFGYRFRSDSGVNVAARAGLVFNRTLVFGKLGIGIAHAEDRFSFEGSGSLCVRSTFVNICEASLPVGSAAFTLARWSPSILAGVGIEHNLGRFFVRASAELEGITGLKGFSSLSVPLAPGGRAFGFAQSEPFWTTRGTALVGFRF